ncbi:UDP-N-acetylmuramoyl-tripeptide--D-alanyl-D-alanine ligase [Hyella patelloides LEGE 07179]|uniref:UDP-N-acetylmuramoyl-tripeptide--D-alanyl-D-alanine ligase n=1 Tax=Hyella patelloides LEGE 07179 TaxID=945734 RepID=A0A563W5K7_9CYAN|nr:UDP-N-acetylmuramoyl-tripeptide--D-alanyl-D-alanine ligase [Hyella patelloides]VEP18979.1 UDP-N-acetylmuramoyl-tripeptide--D-alanyl-D-alanine ligase [Hyella patelloides LEGE 07179]
MTVAIPLVELPKIFVDNLTKIIANDETKIAQGINTDTRHLQSEEIFLALVGEKFDGHDFVTTAIERKAIAIIISRELSLTTTIPQFIVKDTLKAYQQIARWWRDRVSIPIIGITGSVGKTSTKELIAAVLGTQGKVLKTQKNYNNEIGVPKTLLEITSEHDYAVIEMAMRGKGEIALLTEIAQPTIGVITNVGTAHIGRLGSEKAIADAKCELLATMPQNSTAILNHDNPLLITTAAEVWQGKTITYGLEGGDIQGQLVNTQTLQIEKESYPLPLLGIHNASNYLAAIAVAQILDIDLAFLKAGLTVELPQGRARRYQLYNDILLLDETYNAGLESMQAALKMLKETPGTRHIAVLGTMKELGNYAAKLHYRIGETVKNLKINLLFVLADEPATEEIIKGAVGVNAECFTDRQQLALRLQEVMKKGDRILFKASNSVGLNQVVEQLK